MDYNARFYSPRLGRFTQPDTIVPGMSSQAYNRYSYVNNNPIMMTDPSGHRPAGACEEWENCGGNDPNAGDDYVPSSGCGYYCDDATDPLEEDVGGKTGGNGHKGNGGGGSKGGSSGSSGGGSDLEWWEDPAIIDKIAMDTQDIATAFSAAGFVAEVTTTGLGCIGIVFVGCLGGLIAGIGVHKTTTDKAEIFFSLVSFGLTVYSDTLKGNTDLAQGKYGRDTKQSATSALWGAVIPIGGLDFALDLYASAYNRGKVGTFEESIDFLNNALADAINSLIQGEP